MKKICLVLLGVILLVGLLSVEGFCWIGDERLREIDERILETERRLLDLGEGQLLNRLEWADWGVDLLNQDAKSMEEEIARERERWRELRKESYNSERAWSEWEEVGRKLDRLEQRKRRLHRVLSRLKKLRSRLGARLWKVRRISRPGPFRLGLGVGWLNRDSTTVVEIEMRILDTITLFYGGNGYTEEDRDRLRFDYLGGEILLGKVPCPFTSSVTLRFPLGVEFIQEDIQLCTGFMVEGNWENTRGETTKGFGQVRLGLGENPLITLLVGVIF